MAGIITAVAGIGRCIGRLSDCSGSCGTVPQAFEDNFNQLIFAVVLIALRLAMVSYGEVKLDVLRRTC